jgi:ankyrin repeat protein
MIAARNNFIPIFDFLIHKKAAISLKDNSGGTLLHSVAEHGSIMALNQLVALGVDTSDVIEVADHAGRTPIFEAVEGQSQIDIL